MVEMKFKVRNNRIIVNDTMFRIVFFFFSNQMKAQPNMRPLKVAIIGYQSVGKTSLVNKFHFNMFEKNTLSTIGSSFVLHEFNINGVTIPLQLWDTAGQEKYRSIGPIYYRDAVAAIAVYDLTAPESVEHMKDFLSQFQEYCQTYAHIAIIGNKLDLYQPGKSVDPEKIKQWAQSEGYSHYLTSSLTGEGVNEAFQTLAEIISTKTKRENTDGSNISETASLNSPSNSTCC